MIQKRRQPARARGARRATARLTRTSADRGLWLDPRALLKARTCPLVVVAPGSVQSARASAPLPALPLATSTATHHRQTPRLLSEDHVALREVVCQLRARHRRSRSDRAWAVRSVVCSSWRPNLQPAANIDSHGVYAIDATTRCQFHASVERARQYSAELTASAARRSAESGRSFSLTAKRLDSS